MAAVVRRARRAPHEVRASAAFVKEIVMKKLLLSVVALGLFGAALVGCKAEGQVDKPASSASTSVLPR